MIVGTVKFNLHGSFVGNQKGGISGIIAHNLFSIFLSSETFN
jgi:hypothetical protein